MTNEKIDLVKAEDIQVATVEQLKERPEEIRALTSEIQLGDVNTVVNFGKGAADEISKCSDMVLRSVEADKVASTGVMLKALGNIMDKFDPKELEDVESKNIFKRLFVNAQKQLEQILSKYNTMGGEIDKIYIELKQYEEDIYKANEHLEQMYNNNVSYYQTLAKYILAGEDGIGQLEAYRQTKEQEYKERGDESTRLEIQTIEQSKQLLEQRVQDLRMAEMVAMQSIPMIRSMQFSNLNLVRKINSAFIITLPAFKQMVAQAVMLKRQKIQIDAMTALDDRTNEMLVRNAQNTAEQTKRAVELAGSTSIKMETLETTWNVIMTGIDETRKIQQTLEEQRGTDKQKLEDMKHKYEKMGRE